MVDGSHYVGGGRGRLVPVEFREDSAVSWLAGRSTPGQGLRSVDRFGAAAARREEGGGGLGRFGVRLTTPRRGGEQPAVEVGSEFNKGLAQTICRALEASSLSVSKAEAQGGSWQGFDAAGRSSLVWVAAVLGQGLEKSAVGRDAEARAMGHGGRRRGLQSRGDEEVARRVNGDL